MFRRGRGVHGDEHVSSGPIWRTLQTVDLIFAKTIDFYDFYEKKSK